EDYEDQLDEEGKDYLKEIQRGAHRMTRLIDDLLSLSRVSRIRNPYEQVSIGELIETVLERIEFDVKEGDVDLRMQEDLPTVICDRIKLGEVFLNLINNAIKFSSKDNPERPRVAIGGKKVKGGYEFFVQDNGIGIDPQFHDQVFDLFKRLHAEKDYDGTGAGLSIVKRIIEDHQGRVWIESELGKGSIFHFFLPDTLKIK
ncbi:MAG: hypothetical protein K8I00_11835, partial [Candidatus Omnitrophica bacterium]|nr:hypothetical protein [Candidatus Omnitrophota bacterium]